MAMVSQGKSKSGSLRCYLPLTTNSMEKTKVQFILSREIDDHRILQSEWTRGMPGHTQLKVVVSNTTFP